LAQQNDESSGSPALPSAELNPLLNPLLGENMGRWAEVYFTSPPEKREEAVLKLLRELKAQNSPSGGKMMSPFPDDVSSAERQAGSHASTQSSSDDATQNTLRCRACGHDNPAAHRFCGACGARLDDENGGESSGVSEHEGDHSDARFAESAKRGEPAVDDIRARLDPERRAFEESIRNPNELSLFRSFSEADSSQQNWEDESPRRYRLIIGAVLAILIAGLAYMAWRSSQATSQSTHEAPPPLPAAAKEAPAPAAATAPSTPPKASEATASSPAAPASPETAEKTETKAAPLKRSHTNALASAAAAAAKPASAQASADHGSEELALAQRYLSGANGERRDSAEAAKWLWKSVAKHNGEATVLLADLYLKGDGVSKNCDQARVLLDSAGRKGVPGAGARLRNLQAFGCQ
jgi:hypothetical protein